MFDKDDDDVYITQLVANLFQNILRSHVNISSSILAQKRGHLSNEELSVN